MLGSMFCRESTLSRSTGNKCMYSHIWSFPACFPCFECGGAGHADAGDGLPFDAWRTCGGVTWWESAEADRPQRHCLLTQCTGGRTDPTGLLVQIKVVLRQQLCPAPNRVSKWWFSGLFCCPPCWCGGGFFPHKTMRFSNIYNTVIAFTFQISIPLNFRLVFRSSLIAICKIAACKPKYTLIYSGCF